MIAFNFSAVVLILSSLAYLVLEVAQFCHHLHRYLLEKENYVQVLMYISVIIFAFPFGQNSCWCLPAWKWQIGALALFLAWLNLLLLIRYIPWLNVGQHSTMLFNVYLNFLKLIYLPILILVAFAIPLYMLLVDSTPTEVCVLYTCSVVLKPAVTTMMHYTGKRSYKSSSCICNTIHHTL